MHVQCFDTIDDSCYYDGVTAKGGGGGGGEKQVSCAGLTLARKVARWRAFTHRRLLQRW